MDEITVIGGGVSGLTAAITCAEGGAEVRLFEAHETLGGRARSTEGPHKANLGPHAIYKGGVLWDWLSQRGLMPPLAKPLIPADVGAGGPAARAIAALREKRPSRHLLPGADELGGAFAEPRD